MSVSNFTRVAGLQVAAAIGGVAIALAAASFTAAALAEGAGETVLIERPLAAFEENYPVSEPLDMALPLSAPAAPSTVERVVLHASYAVFDNRAYIDVDALADAVRAARPGALELRVCGAEAIDAFKRTVPHLSGVALQPQVVDASDAACRAPIALPAAAARAFAAGGDAVAVRYWVEVAP